MPPPAKPPPPDEPELLLQRNAVNRARKTVTKHKRRYCRVEGCTRVVKSQGVCQRHGAKASPCKVEGCTKQAQGNFDGMCKAHFAEMKRTGHVRVPSVVATSVYEEILPESLRLSSPDKEPPLIGFLREGMSKPPAWHRNDERLARSLDAVIDPTRKFEGWEKDMVCTETLLLTGASPEVFAQLAHAWGRDPGFHRALSTSVLERYRSRSRDESSGLAPAGAAEPTVYEGFLKTSLGEFSAFTDIDEEEIAEFGRLISSSDQLPFD